MPLEAHPEVLKRGLRERRLYLGKMKEKNTKVSLSSDSKKWVRGRWGKKRRAVTLVNGASEKQLEKKCATSLPHLGRRKIAGGEKERGGGDVWYSHTVGGKRNTGKNRVVEIRVLFAFRRVKNSKGE